VSHVREAVLILRDGEVFEGEAMGGLATGEHDGVVATGEIVFNTALSGYQEIVTDPSYAGQVITFTYPHIGNYGTNADDDESRRPFCRGVIVRDLARRPSSWRSTEPLPDFLARHGVPGLTGIDTRRLTRHLRDAGAVPGAFGTDEAAVRAAAARALPTDGTDLAAEVTTDATYTAGDPDAPFHVVAYDLGIKTTMLRHLGKLATVEVVPAGTSAADVLAREPDGVFLSNGPGDPAAVTGTIAAIGDLVGEVPIFGICLGHQLLASALGGTTHKLPFGHHGGNHPVKDLDNGRVSITSQNHGFAVEMESLPDTLRATHISLFDGTLQGLEHKDKPAFCFQGHPEASPGPHDIAYLFDRFTALMEKHKNA
jgi:carbamoyl-phosphate synthase small subunit